MSFAPVTNTEPAFFLAEYLNPQLLECKESNFCVRNQPPRGEVECRLLIRLSIDKSLQDHE